MGEGFLFQQLSDFLLYARTSLIAAGSAAGKCGAATDSHGKVLSSRHLSVWLPKKFTNIKRLAQALFGVIPLTLLSTSAGKDRETWRVWSRNETDR